MRTHIRSSAWFATAGLFAGTAMAALVAASFTLGSIQFPTGVTYDGTFLYVSKGSGFRELTVIDPVSQTIVGEIPFGGEPRDVVFDPAGRFFASDVNGFVREIDTTGALVNTFSLPFRGGAIAFDGSRLYVGDLDHSRVLVTDTAGNVVDDFMPGGSAALRPEGMVFDPSTGNLWVITLFSSNLYEMTTAGNLVRTCATPFTPGSFGLGGITLVGAMLYIVEPAGGDPFAGTHIFSLDPTTLVCTPPLVTQVLIDVKPASSANTLNVRNEGVIPVAILTTDTFDAADVDADSVRFGATGTEASAASSALEDVDGDGDLDLMLHFRTAASGIGCSTTAATLTGVTTGGIHIAGTDTLRIIGCK